MTKVTLDFDPTLPYRKLDSNSEILAPFLNLKNLMVGVMSETFLKGFEWEHFHLLTDQPSLQRAKLNP